MQFFIKLNLFSIFLGLFLLMLIKLLLNTYRISRVLSWDLNKVNISLSVIYVIIFIAFPFIISFLITKWLKKNKYNYWSVLLFPYFYIFFEAFVYFFPIVDKGEIPPPIIGLITILIIIFFPIYLLLSIYISHKKEPNKKTTNIFIIFAF